MTDKPLEPQQLRFIDEYLSDKEFNAKQAAIRAGYSEKTAEAQASRLLRSVKVRAEIERRQKKVAKKFELNQEWIIKQLIKVHKRCMQSTAVTDKEGNPIGEYKFEASAANKSLELLGKHLGMFADRFKIGGDKDSPPIKAQINVTSELLNDRIKDILSTIRKAQ